MEDTIYALATPPGHGAIAIIKISGPKSIELINKIFKGEDLLKKESHTITYGHIIDNDSIIDEVLIMLMKAPKTYTKEDIIEINCHGGYVSAERIIKLLQKLNIRLAQPGEFTKRAFLNGRIDLLEAESIGNIINAETEINQEISVNNLFNTKINQLSKIREKIMEIEGNILVNLDYPEYLDINQITSIDIKTSLFPIEKQLKEIYDSSISASIINKGITVALVGEPNVGKSSLLNTLLNNNKAIVTDIAGTTRDIVEGTIYIEQIPIKLIDTAGIRESKEKIEQIGIRKSKEKLEESDLIILVLDNNKILTKTTIKLIEKIEKLNKHYIIVINKIDLNQKIDLGKLPKKNIIKISTIQHKGIKELKEEIIKKYKNYSKKPTTIYTTNQNNINKLNESLELIKKINKNIDLNFPIDIIEIDLKKIWILLGEITGQIYDEELLDNLFKLFCVGK